MRVSIHFLTEIQRFNNGQFGMNGPRCIIKISRKRHGQIKTELIHYTICYFCVSVSNIFIFLLNKRHEIVFPFLRQASWASVSACTTVCSLLWRPRPVTTCIQLRCGGYPGFQWPREMHHQLRCATRRGGTVLQNYIELFERLSKTISAMDRYGQMKYLIIIIIINFFSRRNFFDNNTAYRNKYYCERK